MKYIKIKDITQDIYNFIVEFNKQHEKSPTYSEIMVQFSIASTRGVAYHLEKLQQKKLIKVIPKQKRGIKLSNQP